MNLSNKTPYLRTLVRKYFSNQTRNRIAQVTHAVRNMRQIVVAPSANLTYSQYAEDYLLSQLVGFPKVGFYVDIGASHPIIGSNTYLLYRQGWTGLTIEPNPDLSKLHRRYRPRDKLLCEGVDHENQILTYYCFSDSVLNTFDSSLIAERITWPGVRLVGQERVQVRTMSSILKQYISNDQKIDLINIDAEGLDLRILRSNDWRTYRSHFITIEIYGRSLNVVLSSEITRFLESKGYELISYAGVTGIFRDRLRDGE